MSPVLAALKRVQCGDFLMDAHYAEGHDGPEVYNGVILYVGKLVPDNDTGELGSVQWGRPWFIPCHWSEDKVVATALTAMKFWLEHELREQFTVAWAGPKAGCDTPFYPNH